MHGRINARAGNVGGAQVTLVDVLIASSASEIPAIQALGVKIRSVYSGGVVSATVPLNKLNAVAALTGVSGIRAATRMKMSNDRTQSFVDQNLSTGEGAYGLHNNLANKGDGVIVGVIDSGLDWTHEDFIDDVTNKSRISHYWDQSDLTDSNPPAGFSEGREYVGTDPTTSSGTARGRDTADG